MKKLDDQAEIGKDLFAQITRLQAADSSKLIKLLEKRTKAKDQCSINRALGYLYVRNADFAKAAENFKKVIANKSLLEANDITMATYVFEQVGDNEAAKQLREDSLKTVMAVDHLNTKEQNPTQESPLLLEDKQ